MVGDEVRLYGTGFAPSTDGLVNVRFIGHFQPVGGAAAEHVDLTITLASDTEGTVVWRRFGAYRVPFGRGDRIGQFVGTVGAVNQYFDGSVEPGIEREAMALTFTVEPSIVVTDFRAEGRTWIAGCAVPTRNAINGLTYGMRVRALGFAPTHMEFTVTSGLVQRNAQDQFVAMPGAVTLPSVRNVLEHAVLMEFAPVPVNTDGYRTSVLVRAPGRDGRVRQIEYPLTVRQALQVYFNRPMELAQTFPPEMVSGCIPGGGAGVMTQYAEQRSETRTRAIAHSTEQGWENTYGTQHAQTWGTSASMGGSQSQTHTTTVTDARTVGYTQSSTDGFSNTNGRTLANRIDFSRSGSQSYGWNVNRENTHSFDRSIGANAEVGVEAGVEASGSVGIPLVASGSAGAHASGHINVGIDGRLGWVDGSSDGSGRNGSTTGSASVGGGQESSTNSSQTASRSTTSGSHWEHTQSYADANSETNERNWQNTRSYADARTESRTVAARLAQGTTDTMSLSTTQARSLQITGGVPASQFAVWYRQTSRMVRRGVVIAYDVCGNGSEVGQILVDDWTWAPNLATGNTCPPPSNFPIASCRIAPCD